MQQRQTGDVIQVQYSFLGGAHLFKSAQAPGLRAASPDLEEAYNEVAIQLGLLFPQDNGEPT